MPWSKQAFPARNRLESPVLSSEDKKRIIQIKIQLFPFDNKDKYSYTFSAVLFEMVKVLLTSDLHLGIQQTDLPIRTAERLITLKKIISLAKDHDLLLIAGDLFNSESPDEDILSEVIKLFAYLKKQGTTILISPGEHECGSGKIPDFFQTLGSDKIFDKASDEPFEYRKDAETIFVYGVPASVDTDLSKIGKISDYGFHIGLFHTDLENEDTTQKSRLRVQDLKSLDLDFYALGHNHFFKLYKYQNEIIGAYPGSPEASMESESGDRYVLSLAIDKGEITQIKRLTVNSINVIPYKFNCAAQSPDELVDFIEKNRSPRNLAIITLIGDRTFRIPWEKINELSTEYYHFEINDRSERALEVLVSDFASEKSLRGDYFSILGEKMRNGLPPSVNECQLAKILTLVTKEGSAISEESLCALLDA
jgi:DNA repair exonuclease SbcCD nuclease subunit